MVPKLQPDSLFEYDSTIESNKQSTFVSELIEACMTAKPPQSMLVKNSPSGVATASSSDNESSIEAHEFAASIHKISCSLDSTFRERFFKIRKINKKTVSRMGSAWGDHRRFLIIEKRKERISEFIKYAKARIGEIHKEKETIQNDLQSFYVAISKFCKPIESASSIPDEPATSERKSPSSSSSPQTTEPDGSSPPLGSRQTEKKRGCGHIHERNVLNPKEQKMLAQYMQCYVALHILHRLYSLECLVIESLIEYSGAVISNFVQIQKRAFEIIDNIRVTEPEIFSELEEGQWKNAVEALLLQQNNDGIDINHKEQKSPLYTGTTIAQGPVSFCNYIGRFTFALDDHQRFISLMSYIACTCHAIVDLWSKHTRSNCTTTMCSILNDFVCSRGAKKTPKLVEKVFDRISCIHCVHNGTEKLLGYDHYFLKYVPSSNIQKTLTCLDNQFYENMTCVSEIPQQVFQKNLIRMHENYPFIITRFGSWKNYQKQLSQYSSIGDGLSPSSTPPSLSIISTLGLSTMADKNQPKVSHIKRIDRTVFGITKKKKDNHHHHYHYGSSSSGGGGGGYTKSESKNELHNEDEYTNRPYPQSPTETREQKMERSIDNDGDYQMDELDKELDDRYDNNNSGGSNGFTRYDDLMDFEDTLSSSYGINDSISDDLFSHSPSTFDALNDRVDRLEDQNATINNIIIPLMRSSKIISSENTTTTTTTASGVEHQKSSVELTIGLSDNTLKRLADCLKSILPSHNERMSRQRSPSACRDYASPGRENRPSSHPDLHQRGSLSDYTLNLTGKRTDRPCNNRDVDDSPKRRANNNGKPVPLKNPDQASSSSSPHLNVDHQQQQEKATNNGLSKSSCAVLTGQPNAATEATTTATNADDKATPQQQQQPEKKKRGRKAGSKRNPSAASAKPKPDPNAPKRPRGRPPKKRLEQEKSDREKQEEELKKQLLEREQERQQQKISKEEHITVSHPEAARSPPTAVAHHIKQEVINGREQSFEAMKRENHLTISNSGQYHRRNPLQVSSSQIDTTSRGQATSSYGASASVGSPMVDNNESVYDGYIGWSHPSSAAAMMMMNGGEASNQMIISLDPVEFDNLLSAEETYRLNMRQLNKRKSVSRR